MNKSILVGFISCRLKHDFESLLAGKHQEKQLYKQISSAFDRMKKDPCCATKIPRNIWPRFYIKQYKINNLWKYDLPSEWRLTYTIESSEDSVICIILEWFDHHGYEKRFKY